MAKLLSAEKRSQAEVGIFHGVTRGWVRLSVFVVCAALLLGYAWTAREDSSPVPLTMDGVLLQAGEDRFVLAGASAYVLPFYEGRNGGRDEALAETTQRSYAQREQMLARMKASGVNTLRVPVALAGYADDVYGLGGPDGYLERLKNVVSAAADHDIRVIVGWWDSHSTGAAWLETYRDSFPMMRDVREALRPWSSVMYEPFNEPHDVSWEQWEPVMTDVVGYWRGELDYDGVLFVDTIDYSWSFDPQVAQRIMDSDAGLRGGTSAVVFANHRYANNQTCFCDAEQAEWQEEVGKYVGEFPIAGTEYGRWTGPDFEPQERWNEQFAAYAADVAVPAGLNGYVAFVWDWVDENSMTTGDGQRLNAYGQLIADVIFSKHGTV